jgi:hypothetical protein
MGQPQALPVEVVPPEPAAVPLTFSDVFIPSAAWPGTGHHSESFPPVTSTVTLRVAPGASEGSLTVERRPAPAMSSLCAIVPALCTTNVTLPALLEGAERPMWYSRSVTLIVAAAAELPPPRPLPSSPRCGRCPREGERDCDPECDERRPLSVCVHVHPYAIPEGPDF